MIDAHNTSYEWQLYPGDVCVLPVGSVEQHAEHLPLATDCIEAEYMARMVAHDLDAALLPLQSYGNCLEHSGFRGSVTLRPETLMQVIRDIADAMERQNFRIMIILNGHGGNFPLAPVIRDINRMDRPLKILLINFWEYDSTGIFTPSTGGRPEIHAGEWETSLFMAINPLLVRKSFLPAMDEAPGERFPLQRQDLTTFGTGHFNPHGTLGHPLRASPGKGRRIITSIRANMLPFIRDRIARLRTNPLYAGAGGIAVRTLTPNDIPACMQLKELASWNQTNADWERFMHLHPAGCLAAVRNGYIIGTATAIQYKHRLGWIGMVLVHPDMRRMGIGRLLLEHAIQTLKKCQTIMLDATPAGRPLYAKMGFKDQFGLARMIASRFALQDPSESVQPAQLSDLSTICDFDARLFGVRRDRFIRDLHADSPQLAHVIRRGRTISGFCMGRRGVPHTYIGPVMAGTTEEAIELISAACRNAPHQSFIADIPDCHSGFRAWLTNHGFVYQRPFTRMYYGKPMSNRIECQFAIAGPEVG